MEIKKHKYYMMQILHDIYSDKLLSTILAFKGGTALMFFYELPRLSVDLDFNLLDKEKENLVFLKVKKILQQYGKIDDEAEKYYGAMLVLDYGKNERKLKVEISNRAFDDHYEIKDLLGIKVKVMQLSDMFAHKLCALLDRKEITGRDIFDVWFFLKRQTFANRNIIEERMQISFNEYIDNIIERLEQIADKSIMNGLGELTDSKMKSFIRTKLRKETIDLLRIYKAFGE